MNPAGHGPAAVVERLLEAVNAHDLEAMVALFADDYRNETPAHPQRGFRGNQQVRRNWTQLFAGVPDLRARLPGAVVDGDSVWTDWDISVAGHPRWCSKPQQADVVIVLGATSQRHRLNAWTLLDHASGTHLAPSGSADQHEAAAGPRISQLNTRGPVGT